MYKVFENQQCTEWPQTELEHVTDKSTLYTLNTYPDAQILVRFALRPAVFKIQGRRKTEMHWMTPKLNLNTNSQSYPV